jgi:arginase
VTGLDEAVPGVVWLDAHSDFSEPTTTTSGYMDSMGLSVLTGSAWQGMLATVPGARPLPETTIVLAGARAFDPSEAARLKQSRITHLAPAELRSPEKLIDTVGRLSPEITGLYVHIDLDVLDRAVAGVNVFSEPGGLDGDQLDGLIAALMKTFPVRAVTLSAYDPAYDAGDRVPPIAIRILKTIAGSL